MYITSDIFLQQKRGLGSNHTTASFSDKNYKFFSHEGWTMYSEPFIEKPPTMPEDNVILN